jgi:hypothetical protein
VSRYVSSKAKSASKAQVLLRDEQAKASVSFSFRRDIEDDMAQELISIDLRKILRGLIGLSSSSRIETMAK